MGHNQTCSQTCNKKHLNLRQLLLLTTIALTLASCAQKKSGVSSRASSTSSTVTASGSQCGTSTGVVYASSSASSSTTSFETDVKNFLSATINPNEVGTIDGSGSGATGVKFTAAIKLDSSGNVVSASSQLYFTIIDSYAAQGGYDSYGNAYQPITVKFDQNTGAQFSGQFNTQNNSGQLTIQDSYGTVTLTGTLDAQYFSGTISYQNTQHILGSTPAQGTLGQFRVARCGFLQ